jgi:hypothetical protein
MSTLLGKGLARLVLGLLKLVGGLVVGLLQGLVSPVGRAVARRQRKAKWKRDVRAVKKDWNSLIKGRLGKRGKKSGKRTRRRLKKRFG